MTNSRAHGRLPIYQPRPPSQLVTTQPIRPSSLHLLLTAYQISLQLPASQMQTILPTQLRNSCTLCRIDTHSSGHPPPGCDRQQLEHIARKGLSVRKVSRRDMPLVIGSGLDGATTVSGTMLLAARAGIKVFVTGGVGGVHRWAT